MEKSKWVLDPAHTVVEFSVRHMMFATVKGRFAPSEGVVVTNPQDLSTADIQVALDAASVNTHEPARDAHLRSADFFDADNHPKLTFKSTSIQRLGGDKYKLQGDLTIRGVTRKVEWDLEYLGTGKDPFGAERMAFSAQTRINRKDYGLNWNAALEAGGFLVGDNVDINVSLQAIKQ